MAHYSQQSYWDGRYAALSSDVESFEWYVPYAGALRNELMALLPPAASCRVLVVGSGISLLGEQLHDDGYRDVTCVDFSAAAIERMQRRPERRGLSYVCVDARQLVAEFGKASFEVVIDKAMLDAALCSGEDGAAQFKSAAAIAEALYEVLVPGGVLLSLSHSARTDGCRAVVFHNAVVPWAQMRSTTLESPLNVPGLSHKTYTLFCLSKAISE